MRSIVASRHKKYSYREMTQDILLLRKSYPSLCRVKVIGKSEDRRNLYDIIIGNAAAPCCVLVISALHGREYMTSLLSMKQIEYYLRNYNGIVDGISVKEVLDNIAVHYIPMANPDGVTIAQSGIRGIRSRTLQRRLSCIRSGRTARWKSNARGVDLNRNFPIDFRIQGKRGSEGFSGLRPASETETRALAEWIHFLAGRNLCGVINYHATGSIIFGDCHNTGSLAVQTEKMYRLAAKLTGYGSASDHQTAICGNLREYIMYREGVPSITLEIGHLACPGPVLEFPFIWKRNRSLVLQEAGLLQKNSYRNEKPWKKENIHM